MSKYVEVRRKRRQPKPQLEHIELWANHRGDAHIVRHHFDDNSVVEHEFVHDRPGNEAALAHLAQHLQMQMGPNAGDEQEEEA